MEKNLIKAYSYDNVSIVSDEISTLAHRSDANTSMTVLGINLDIPIIAAPMPDVCNSDMAFNLAKFGGLGIIHRFQSIEEQVSEYNRSKQLLFDHYDNCNIEKSKNFACAIGTTDDYKERFKELYKSGCRIFCIDTANGANLMVKNAVEYIRNFETSDCTIDSPDTNGNSDRYYTCIKCGYKGIDQLDFRAKHSYNHTLEKIYIIAGNVATARTYRYLSDLGVDAVRVGIAGGCFTPDMSVNTPDGNIPIKDIHIGQYVYSHDSTINKVIDILKYEKNEEILSINNIECTKNHEFYVCHKKYENVVTEDNIETYAEWISAENLTDDYFLIKIN